MVSLESFVFGDDEVHDADVINPAGSVVLPHLVGRHEIWPDLGVLDVVVDKLVKTLSGIFPIGGLVVEEALHHLRPRVELFPCSGDHVSAAVRPVNHFEGGLTHLLSGAGCELPPPERRACFPASRPPSAFRRGRLP